MATFADMPETVNPLSEFYDSRYRAGYMESWEADRLQRVGGLLQELGLPERGRALDFGCGNGVFTGLLRRVLPAWEVYGTEISPTALRNAAIRHPDCRFLPPQEAMLPGGFDFIFSHHVIEHVEDLAGTFDLLGRLSAPRSVHLHILPCGNPGSYEHALVKKVTGGIEAEQGDRFHFEEPGHLRRLTSEAFDAHMRGQGFDSRGRWFANQYWGGIDWITKTSPRFIRRLTDARQAVDGHSAAFLRRERVMLMALTLCQFSKTKYDGYRGMHRTGIGGYLAMALLFLPMLMALPLWNGLRSKAAGEWRARRHEPNGSEMYLAYTRDTGPDKGTPS